MKIAGRKNNGAWSRTNKLISELELDERANLAGSIADAATCPNAEAAFGVLEDMKEELGLVIAGAPTTVNQWASYMTGSGIPLGVWMGNLSFSTYERTGVKKAYKYKKKGAKVIRQFGNELRKACKRYFYGRRLLKDMYDLGTRDSGNPSGNPDGEKDT